MLDFYKPYFFISYILYKKMPIWNNLISKLISLSFIIVLDIIIDLKSND